MNPSTEIGKKAKKEAKNLEDVRRLRSDRLIKAVAYFQLHTASRTKHCFLFPFAKYGNLWYFWAKGSKELEKEGGLVHRGHNSYLVWVFSQLIEMADALVELHKPDPNIRHGDLKPENILCFQDDHSAERAPPIRLVITDVGISKGHKNKTEARAVTSTEVSTTRYEPPEMELTIQDHSKLSRRYDVWSMGCIFLEFLFWLLYDFKELLKFTQAFSDGRFYSKADKKPARVRSEVKHWMSRIKNDKKSCPPHTPLWRLVSLIEEKLLVVRVETLEASQNAATEAPTQGSLLSRWLGRKEKPRREITQQATSFIGGLKHSPGRVSAQEMSEELKEILNDIQARGFEVNRASG